MVDNIADYIDHTLLKPDATLADIEQIIDEALMYNFSSVCVNPYWVSHCYTKLKNADVNICTVIGFPLGASSMKTKVYETKQAIKDGANEIDMVINIGELKSNNYAYIKKEIEEIVKITKGKALLKVIIETALLTEIEKEKVCHLVKEAKADFIKTSTGFANGGATIKDVKLLHDIGDGELSVKASGGIRDKDTAKEMLDAGASRLGTSAGIKIVTD